MDKLDLRAGESLTSRQKKGSGSDIVSFSAAKMPRLNPTQRAAPIRPNKYVIRAYDNFFRPESEAQCSRSLRRVSLPFFEEETEHGDSERSILTDVTVIGETMRGESLSD